MGTVKLVVTVVLSLAMFMAGINKLTPAVHAETHARLLQAARLWVTVPPCSLIVSALPRVTSLQVVQAIGYAEVGSAVLLWFPVLDTLACVVLMGIMAGATATNHTLGNPVVVDVVLLGLACLRFLLAKGGASKRRKDD